MFLGHYALALGVKRRAPRTNLGVLMAAAQLPDLIWPVLLLLGVERVAPGDHGFTALRFVDYPWSHSLLMVVVTGILAGVIYRLATGRRDPRGAMLVALLATSHWVLDWITHRPDLPLYPGGSARLGLGLWNSAVATVAIEGLMWIVGIWLYVAATRPVNRGGRYAFWSLIALLTFIYVGSIASPPPADLNALAWAAMVGWLVPFWAAWADRGRRPVGGMGTGDPS